MGAGQGETTTAPLHHEIREYHALQKYADFRLREADGTELGQRVTPLDRVGLYVPCVVLKPRLHANLASTSRFNGF